MPILIGLLVGAALLLRANKNSSALATQDQKPTPSPAPAAGAAGALGAVGAEAAAATAAAIAGFNAGVQADKIISGGDSDTLTQTTAGVGGGLLAAGAVLLAFGTLTGPLYAIIVAVVVLTYAVVIFINDQEELAYGQEGARKDYDKQWDDVYAQCFHKLRIDPNFANITDTEIKRALTPFIDGYMQKLNEIHFYRWWRTPKGITEAGLNTEGHLVHGEDRGKFVGMVKRNGTNSTLFWDHGDHYRLASFLEECVPPEERSPPSSSFKAGPQVTVTKPGQMTITAPTSSVVALASGVHVAYNSSTGRVGPMPGVNPQPGAIPPVPTASQLSQIRQAAIAANPNILAQANEYRPGQIDPKAGEWFKKGQDFCNLIQYRTYMVNNPDNVPNPDARIRLALSRNLFEGSVGTKKPGDLVWAGQEFNYADLDNELGGL